MSRKYITRRLPVENVQATRKKLQLCRQVQHALMWAIGSEITNELAHCSIESVEPLPGGNRLLVKIGVPADLSIETITERLSLTSTALRTEVAQAITRRKAPELIFLPVPIRQ